MNKELIGWSGDEETIKEEQAKIKGEEKRMTNIIKDIFWKGKTEMGVVWLMFILGIIIGVFLFR